MGLVAAGFYLSGALLALLVTLWEPVHHPAAIRMVAALAALSGVGVLVLRRRPAWSYHAFDLLGTALVTLIIVLTGGGAPAMAMAAVYFYVPLDSFFFFPWQTAVVYQGWGLLALVLDSAVFHVLDGTVAAGIGITEIVAAFVVWGLVRAAGAAEVDSTTGLPNRRGYDRALAAAIAQARRTGEALSVAYFDLDHFKAINDSDGHGAGDRRLHAVAQTWSRQLPEQAVLARQGGDEFAVLLPGVGLAAAVDIAEALRVSLAGQGFTCSGGVTQWDAATSGSSLMSRADIALYRAKRAGRNRVHRYERGAEDDELRAALAAGQFWVAYQPTVALDDHRLAGAEALLRWRHPQRGFISPEEFIPVAERSGLICALGHFVLEEACRTAQRTFPADAYIAVNVSGAELGDPSYADEVLEILSATKLPPTRLVLEVTETTLAADSDVAIRILQKLREKGIRVAIDDFGVGFSSLGRLTRLPVDILKLDRSFVAALTPGRLHEDQGSGARLVAAVSSLATAVGLQTIAEGIESPGQAQLLRACGFGYGQGYLFGRPVADEAFLMHTQGRMPVPQPRSPNQATPGQSRRSSGRGSSTTADGSPNVMTGRVARS